ncbi:AP2 domain protein [compost metagenome]
MLRRVYDEKMLKNNPSYVDSVVEEEWNNFQNFAEFYNENYYEIEGERVALDKDILVKKNKAYSPETSLFVPQRINNLFVKPDLSKRELPIGVTFDKQTNKYKAQCGIGKRTKSLGRYNTPEESFNAYKTYKESVIKQVANEYKDKIPLKLYEALMRYEVEITD